MVTHSGERIPAISTVRGKRSRECGNYATQQRTPSSTISRTISTSRCKRLRLGLRQAKVKRTKQSRCCMRPPMPKTFWASIRFRRAHLFQFANSSAVCYSNWANRRTHNGNSKLRSKSIRDDSEDYTERHELPSNLVTRKMQAAIMRSWPHKRQSLVAHEMN